MSSGELLNYHSIIERKDKISEIMLEDASRYRLGIDKESTNILTSLEPDVGDPDLNFVADTVLLVRDLLPEISLKDMSELDSLPLDEKEARIAGSMAREVLVRFAKSYPDFALKLSDIMYYGSDSAVVEIREQEEARAPIILKAIDIAVDGQERMLGSKKWIY